MFTSLAVAFALAWDPPAVRTGPVDAPFSIAVNDQELGAARAGMGLANTIREVEPSGVSLAALDHMREAQNRDWWIATETRLSRDEQPVPPPLMQEDIGFDFSTNSFSIQQVDYTPGGIATVNVDIKFGEIGFAKLLGQ